MVDLGVNKNSTSCSFPECENISGFKGTGYCISHQRQYRLGEELRPIQSRGNKGVRVECAHEGCEAYARTGGYCKSHYMKWLRTGKTYGPGSPKHCGYENCNRAVDVRGYCGTHYGIIRDGDTVPWSETRTFPCAVTGCDRPSQYGVCTKHSARATRYGLSWEELIEFTRGGMCESCGFEGPDLDIHHDHSCCDRQGSCGKCVVAYLCGSCNKAAGMLRDDPQRARNLAAVLERGSRFAEVVGPDPRRRKSVIPS